MPSNSSVATNMYNTRRAAYMNSCSTALEMPPHSIHQQWQENDYGNTNSENDTSDMPIYPPENDDRNREVEKKTTRKRANTTSSGGGNEKDSKRTANKICRVCGDKAFSYNFNVITCESCKAFFRRNANKEKEIRCPFNDQCEINMVSRRFCQRCRLTKCFNVGMKKEWIMSEEARLEKKQRVEENRERRMRDAISSMAIDAQMEDESDNSFDETHPSGNITVREFLTTEELQRQAGLQRQVLQQQQQLHSQTQSHNHEQHRHHQDTHQHQQHNTDEMSPHVAHHSYNVNDKMADYYQDGPTDYGYSNQEYDYSQQLPQNSCASTCPNSMENDYCGTTTIADTGASSSNIPSTIESKPIPSSAFLPASLSAIKDVAAIISQAEPPNLGICGPEVVDGDLINLAVQAQAVVNHQIAAAVVASQVVSQMTPVMPVPPLDPLLAPAIIAATPALPIAPPPPLLIQPPPPPQPAVLPTQPPPGAPINIPVIPKEMPVNGNLLVQLEQTASDMVTVPKDMLMKLIQNMSRTSCTCTCVCGRYPPGSTIVDEVTNDLLNGGSSNSSNAEKDEARLETTEDMQINGLIPGESNSSIEWLSQQSSAPNLIDPISHTISAEEEQTQRERRDSLFTAHSSAEMSPLAQPPKSVHEETFWEHTVSENETRELTEQEVERMEELEEITSCWLKAELETKPILELFEDDNIDKVIRQLKLLSSFRFMPMDTRRYIVKNGVYSYLVVRWMQHKESMSLNQLPDRIRRDFMKLVKLDEFKYRVQPGAFNALAVAVLFYCSQDSLKSTEGYLEHLSFKRLLEKTLPIKVTSDHLLDAMLPGIAKAAKHLKHKSLKMKEEMITVAISDT